MSKRPRRNHAAALTRSSSSLRRAGSAQLASISQAHRLRGDLAVEVIAVSVADAAALLGFGRTHIYRLLRRDPTFPRLVKFGRPSRILVEDLRE